MGSDSKNIFYRHSRYCRKMPVNVCVAAGEGRRIVQTSRITVFMFVFIRNQTMHSLVRSLFIIRAKSKYFVLRPSLANVFSLFRFRFTKCVQRHSIFGVDLMCVACLGFFRCCFFFLGLSMLLYLVWMFRFKPSRARYPVAIYGVCSISNLKVFSCFLVLKRRTKLFHESVYSQWIFLCFLFFFRSIFFLIFF